MTLTTAVGDIGWCTTRHRTKCAAAHRYRVLVIAVSATEVVQSMGGWLVHQAMAGWEVTAACTAEPGKRALRILGVNTGSVTEATQLIAAEDPGLVLAVVADAPVMVGDPPTHATAITTRSRTAYVLCSAALSTEVDGDLAAVQYHISSAAQVFKRHALDALGLVDQSTTALEHLRHGPWTAVTNEFVPFATAFVE